MSYVAIGERGANGSEWRATPDQYESLLHRFEEGRGILTFTTPDGAEVNVRASDIVAITFLSDDTIARIAEREASQRLKDV